jgi:hypothetical protein
MFPADISESIYSDAADQNTGRNAIAYTKQNHL